MQQVVGIRRERVWRVATRTQVSQKARDDRNRLATLIDEFKERFVAFAEMGCAGYLLYPSAKLACKNPSFCLLLLDDSSEEEYNRKHASAHLYQGGMHTVQRILTFVTCLTHLCLRSLHHRFVTWTKPDTNSLLLATLTDLSRSKFELVAENALLRQQLIILRRQVKRPTCTKTDRMLLVLLARIVRTWKQALVIVQPETVLRGPRLGFKLFWKYKSRAASTTPRISQETVTLIKEMARDNRRLRSRADPGRIAQSGPSPF
jgi:hypothetical protein